MAKIDQKVKEIIGKMVRSSEAEVTPTVLLAGELGADCFDLLELVLTLEEIFEIEIPNAEAESIHTVQDAIDCAIRYARGGGKWSPSTHGVAC